MGSLSTRSYPLLPLHGWAGVAMIVLFWSLNWSLDGPRTHVYFFPMWLGYVLAVDGLVLMRRGTSILTRSRREFAFLFVFSAPSWWIFELFNWRTKNWSYIGAELFSDLEYAILATIAFSTVMPAVLETAELVRSFEWTERWTSGPRLKRSGRTAAVLFSTGCLLVIVLLAWPDVFYPFIWASVFCLLEPINIWTGRPSMFDYLQRRDWRPVVSLALGALICGFFWELWNYFAYPKWTYRTPGVEFLHLFEMPLLGYIGYLPFGLELFSMGHLARGRNLNVEL